MNILATKVFNDNKPAEIVENIGWVKNTPLQWSSFVCRIKWIKNEWNDKHIENKW